MKKAVLIICMLLVLLAGCQAAPAPTPQAAGETQAPPVEITTTSTPEPTATAQPSPTQTPAPTDTLAPTLTATETLVPTAAATETPEITSTPDPRVYSLDPQKILLVAEDTPPEGKYFIPGVSWTDVAPNETFLIKMGEEKGREFLTKTGRISGDWQKFIRSPQVSTGPEEILVQIDIFRSVDGARLALEQYNPVTWDTKHPWELLPFDQRIGDDALVYAYKKADTAGRGQIEYVLAFTKQNYLVTIDLWGYETEVNHAIAVSVGEKVIENIEALPLGDTVSATPKP